MPTPLFLRTLRGIVHIQLNSCYYFGQSDNLKSWKMVLKDICAGVSGRAVSGMDRLDGEVSFAFASDLMSDVLTLKCDGFLLLTGLANIQAVRTAEMSDAGCLLLCRGKKATGEMLNLAEESGMVIIESPYSMFKCAGLLFAGGLQPVY